MSGTPSGFSPFVCACFAVNYIIGGGFLSLPWAFYKGGMFLSVLFIALICTVAKTSTDYVLSAMARAEYYHHHLTSKNASVGVDDDDAVDDVVEFEPKGWNLVEIEDGGLLIPHTKMGDSGEGDDESTRATEATSLANSPMPFYQTNKQQQQQVVLQFNANQSLQKTASKADNSGVLVVGERTTDVPEMCRLFLGSTGFFLYTISISLYLYGVLWAYSSIFGSAMAQALPLHSDDDYALYVLIYALFMVPMSMLELSEQITVQLFLSACRFLMIALIVFTPIVAAIMAPLTHDPHFGNQLTPAAAASSESSISPAPLVEFSGLHLMLPIIVFAAVFHHSIPGLADEMTDKTQLGHVFQYTFLLCGIAYSLIGLSGAWYFGSAAQEAVNLNWGQYHAGTGQFDDDTQSWTHVSWWASYIAFYVVFFPSLDVLSAFPLNAFVLGNNLMGAYFGSRIRDFQDNRTITTFFRLLASLPPILGSIFIRQLGIISDFCGIIGLTIAFVFPSWLYLASDERLRRCGMPTRTLYQTIGSSTIVARFFMSCGTFATLIGMYSIFVKESET